MRCGCLFMEKQLTIWREQVQTSLPIYCLREPALERSSESKQTLVMIITYVMARMSSPARGFAGTPQPIAAE
jgi:hypothetical protein